MTLDKAIRLKEAYLRNPLCNLNPAEIQADKLSIEAMKRLQTLRKDPYLSTQFPLPSEPRD